MLDKIPSLVRGVKGMVIIGSALLGTLFSMLFFLSDSCWWNCPKPRSFVEEFISHDFLGNFDITILLIACCAIMKLGVGKAQEKEKSDDDKKTVVEVLGKDVAETKPAEFLAALSSFWKNLSELFGKTFVTRFSFDNFAPEHGSPKPVPRTKERQEGGSTKAELYQEMSELRRRKRALERKLKTEARFYALQDRLGELLSRDHPSQCSPAEDRASTSVKDPIRRSRAVMLGLNRRLKEVEARLEDCQRDMVVGCA